MKRRTFLQTTGLALAASPALAGEKPASNAPPKLLITSADTPLAQAIATDVARAFRVTLTSAVETQSQHPFTKCDLFDATATAALVRGMSAIVHVAEPPPGTVGPALIDYRTRGTYGLLQAADREGVSHVVYLSSLEVMLGHEAAYQVTEDWRPRPAAEPEPLSHLLGEATCREFAREGKLRIAVLRLGHPAAGQDPLRLEPRDAVHAVARALLTLAAPRPKLEAWSVFHIVSELRNRRFPPTKARQLLEYRPQTTA